jgi:hypothetical protein
MVRMKAWIALCMMIPACGGGGSAKPDAKMEEPPDAQACFGSFPAVCFTEVPTKPVMLTADLTIDTSASAMCDQHNDQMAKYCVVAGTSFTLAAAKTIRATGTKPLVLLSTSTMSIQGIIDVSSNRMAGPLATGAGANPTACTNGAPPEMAGGGYGGSFGGKGGNGERLGTASATSGVAAAALTTPPTLLRGGCPGGNGDATGGTGGSGGGAVALIAMTSIQLDGKLNASGSAGHGGPAAKSGGGGGGSGGMIVLDAPSITAAATGLLFANGGGGGQGGAGAGAGMGIGADGGESLDPASPAPAGNNGGRDGGFGGTGSSGTRLPGNNGGIPTTAQNNGGGGGGGGAAGFIRAKGITTNIAPPSFVQ